MHTNEHPVNASPPRKTTDKRGGHAEPNAQAPRAPGYTGALGTRPATGFPAPRVTSKDHSPAGPAKPSRKAPVAVRMTPRPDYKH